MRKLLSVLSSTLQGGVRGGLLFFALLVTTTLWAHDFEVNGIYYNYLDGNNVEVTYKGDYSDSYSNEYSGEVTIPEIVTYNGTTYSVTSIGYWAFYDCSSLTSITLPNSVTSIGNSAFSGCSSLTSINIPNSVTSIEYGAFSGTGIYNDESNWENDVLYIDNCLINAKKSISGAYTIKENTRLIANSAFGGCSSLTSINIPNSVTSIGNYAFSRCSSLTSITIPYSVTSIGEWAFSYCSSLTSVTIGNSVTSIGELAFYDCKSLTSVTIGNSVTSIGGGAFEDCSALTSITCLGTTPPTLGTSVFNRTKLSIVYIPDNTLSAYQTAWGNEYVFVNNETILTLHVATPGTLSDLIFDAGTRPINVAKLILTGTLNDADFTCMRETMTSLVDVDLSGITNTDGVRFNGKSKLVKLILPANLTSIGEGAFYDCSSLTSITIPNSVTSIGNGAFEYCFSLASITIPNSVTSIGEYAFQNCSSLTSVTIGNSVTSIGEDAFRDCSSLTSVTIPNSVTSIGLWAFYGCSSLTSITIPESVTSIGGGAFLGCRSLISVTIPNSVTSIGWSAFSGCSSLTSITIPNSVINIGDQAFRSCSSLTSITCLPNTPPTVSDIGANTASCKLLVPKSAYNAYLRHTYWGQFLDLVYGYEVTLSTNNNQWGEVTGAGLYPQDSTITITATPNEGYTFLRWSDGNTDNPRTLTVTKDITLTAEFVEYRDMTIIFTNSEDNDSEIYSQSLTLTIPPAPEIEGFTFLYWQPVAEPLTDVITIQAIYEADVLSSAPDVFVNPSNPAQKLLRNGQVYILQDGQTYTIQGQKL